MIGLFVLTALCPPLSTPRFERGWVSYWKQGVIRRLTPLLLVGIMGSGTMAQAQFFDSMNFKQNFVHYAAVAEKWVQDEWKYIEQQTVEKPMTLLREASLAYRAYKQARQLYQRLAGGSINVSLVKFLPYLEIDSDLPNGQSEVIKIRPIFTPQTRIQMFHGPRFKIEHIDWKNLDFDVDRNVAGIANPDAGLTDDDLQTRAQNDGWASWKLAQDSVGLRPEQQGIPGSGDYQVGISLEPYYQQRLKNMQDIAARTLEAYGEDSIQYQGALQALTDWQKTAGNDQVQEGQAIEAQLKIYDEDAKVQIEKYASHAYELSAATARAYNNRANIHDIAVKYDTDPNNKGFSLLHFLNIAGSVASLESTLNAMGGAPNKQAIGVESAEPMGQATKTVALLYHQAETGNQAIKLQTRRSMEESQQEAKAVAKRKADYLNRVQDTRNAQLAQDALVKARVALRTQTRGLELQNTALLLPDGVTPILSDADVPLVPGAVGSDQAAAAMAKNLTNISKVATQGLSDDVANTIQASSKDMSWGPIRLIVQGVEAAYKAFTGSTMGLTKWTEATINVT